MSLKIDYEALGSVRHEFRLLRLKSISSSRARFPWQLHPETKLPPVVCELYHAFRDDKPYYQTLSYTWGSPNPPTSIYINDTLNIDDKLVHVGQNLARALEYIREEEQDVHLWVDALCINQLDNAEKTYQVRQMRDIYGDAVRTIAWLGEEQDNSGENIEGLNKIGEYMVDNGILDSLHKMLELSASTDARRIEKGDAAVREGLSPIIEDYCEEPVIALKFLSSFEALTYRPYWSRVWVLQEFYASKEVVIRCGKATIPFDYLLAAWICAQEIKLNAVDRVYTSRLPIYFCKLLDLVRINPSMIGMIALRQRRYRLQQSEMTLLEVLNAVFLNNITMDATLDEDRLFALLGMAKDAQSLGIEPNYDSSKTCEEIYTNTARAMIAAGNVDLLALAQHRWNARRVPSWVPDWREEISKPCCYLSSNSWFSASGSRPFQITPDFVRANPNELKLYGYKLDTITLAEIQWMPEGGDESDGCKVDRLAERWQIILYLDSIKQLCGISEKQMETTGVDPYPNPEDRIDAHKRIPIGDQEVFSKGFMRRAGSTGLEGYDLDEIERLDREELGLPERIDQDNAPQELEPSLLNEPWAMKSYYFVLGQQRFRRAVMTQMGFVETAPIHAEEGDIFVIFPGAKVPYVLREEEDGCYSLIGEGYLHGVMYGEFLKREGREVPDMGEFLLR